MNIFYFSVCTQLLTSSYDDEALNMYLQLLDKCINHEVSYTSKTNESQYNEALNMYLQLQGCHGQGKSSGK